METVEGWYLYINSHSGNKHLLQLGEWSDSEHLFRIMEAAEVKFGECRIDRTEWHPDINLNEIKKYKFISGKGWIEV